VYTVAAKSFVNLEIVLSRPKRPRRQFFSRYVKERFRILDIQITILPNDNSIIRLSVIYLRIIYSSSYYYLLHEPITEFARIQLRGIWKNT
jgi:hypothetical protein